MNATLHNPVYKFLYCLIFIVVVSVLLVLWAVATEPLVHLQPVISLPLGFLLLAGGLFLVTLGISRLVVYGKGMAMNSSRLQVPAQQAISQLIPHPIHLGFSLCCFGTAILFKSPSGFWLVAPIAAVGSAALVYGLKTQDMIDQFGVQVQKYFISLPAADDRRPTVSERVSVYVLVLIPWIAIYEAFVVLGIPGDAVVAYFPFEHRLPVLEWTEIIYAATYILVGLVPLVAATSRILREFSIAALFSIVVMSTLFISFPLIAPPREFIPQGFFGRLLLFERNYDTAAAAFPSYHVVWAIITASAFAKTFPGKRVLWWAIAFLIAVSCVTTSMHAIVDIAAGAITGLVFLQYKQLWAWIRSLSERVANSWQEKSIGPVRIINMGVYTGLAGGIAILICGTLLGPEMIWYILITAFSAIMMAGLWGQLWANSSSTSRSFGYYGGVIGISLGVLLADFLGGDGWLLLGASAVAGPFIQACGRMGCLVQGCCHGRKAPAYIGIRHTHPRSQVCRMTNLAGIPLHPTALYSILWNVVIGIVLVRFWILGIDSALIAGLYLILNGLGRFVEESYRGDPQTISVGKLTLYQVMAIVSFIAGVGLTTVNSGFNPPNLDFNIVTIIMAVIFGLITWLAMGVDFPHSNKRFARLM